MNIPPLDAAVIDIGSNSIRLMHAAVTPQGATVFGCKRLITTRLAEGLDEHRLLNEAAIARTLDAISTFVVISREKKTQRLFAYATSAVRDAKNGAAFCARVRDACNVEVDVLSGVQEASFAYRGAVGSAGGGLIDIGGGSAQVMTPARALSFPIGCVRAKDRFGSLPLQQAYAQMTLWLDTCCAPLSGIREARWTGVGGSITTLAALQAGLCAYDSAVVNNESLTPAGLSSLIRNLDGMGEARRMHPLLINRHDVILFGAGVLLYLMRRLDIREMAVSDSDGMEGYFMEKAAQILQ